MGKTEKPIDLISVFLKMSGYKNKKTNITFLDTKNYHLENEVFKKKDWQRKILNTW